MIVRMGFIREKGRPPDPIAGHMQIEQQQDISPTEGLTPNPG